MNSSTKLRNLRKGLGHGLVCLRKYTSEAIAPEIDESSKGKSVKHLELDEKVASALEKNAYHPRRHPGVSRKKADELPEALVQAMEVITEGRKKLDILQAGVALRQRLWGRHLPPERSDYVEKMKLEKLKTEATLTEIDSDINNVTAHKIQEKIVTRRMQDLIHPWHPLGVTPETCLQYFVSRIPAEYCVLHKILSEVKQRDPDFVPLTLFDFGSGTGSGYWAVKEVWQRPQEVYNIDINLNMIELAKNILRIAKEQDSADKGMYFRQFFPVSQERTYDIVLSAFTLLELPSFKERMEAIARLWSKSNEYLVIVEDGTNAGYKAIIEARNLIIHLESQNDLEGTEAHVVAPCPHEFVCPRFQQDDTPCNFEISFLNPRFLEGKQDRRTHLYSYVVLKKGARPNDKTPWPRSVRETQIRSKQVHLKLCTPEGKLEDAILFKQHNCKLAYKCAKHTAWGDLLPGRIVVKEKK